MTTTRMGTKVTKVKPAKKKPKIIIKHQGGHHRDVGQDLPANAPRREPSQGGGQPRARMERRERYS